MKTPIFAIALLSAVAIAGPKDDQEFIGFLAKYNKSIKNSSEMAKRKGNWNSAKWKVASLNSGSKTATFDMNFTSDMDDEEYGAMLGLDKEIDPRKLEDLEEEFEGAVHGRHLQTTIDWSVRPGGKGNVYAVKNQGNCGSCWAFAAIGVVEAMVSIKMTAFNGGVLVAPVRLSEQQLVDCAGSYGNYGCNGGWMHNAWNYIKDNGSMTHADYPYTGVNGFCLYDATKIVARVTVHGAVTSATALTRLLRGPLTIALSAGNNVFRYYSSGILTSANLCPTRLDHGVLLVGHESVAATEICRIATYYQEDPISSICPDQSIEEALFAEKALTANEATIKEATFAEEKLLPDYDCPPRPRCFDGEIFRPATLTSQALCCRVTPARNNWVIQNSWGTGWGDQGFIKFAREDTGPGVCGMNAYIRWAEVCV